ncbi:MAG: nicotinate-nucleotide--dimethylbenzimidazole phosphoribosyltransferase [Bacteroidota bacterium]
MNITKELQNKINLKTKPLGALGQLEKIAFQIGKIQNSLAPELKHPTILVFAGDHGIAASGVSAYPSEVTFQMVMNFLNGGAAINVFSKQNNIALKIIDAGVDFDFSDHPNLIQQKIAKGTQNFLQQKAMNGDQLHRALELGKSTVINHVNPNCNIIGFGEMGISNTSAASLLMSYICKTPVTKCVGRGTGLDDEQLQKKISMLEQAKLFHGDLIDPLEILATFGGFEIAQMCGAMLQAFEKNMILLIDGFIATSAFLIASKINPRVKDNAIFCHLSDEHAHRQMLDFLDASPILQLQLRLGEGTGCAIAYPIIQSAVAFLNEMASFESAGVAGR